MESWLSSSAGKLVAGPAAKEARRSGDGKRRRTEKNGSLDMQRLVQATAKLSLQTARQVRLNTALTVTTALAPTMPLLQTALNIHSDATKPTLGDILRWSTVVSSLSHNEKVSAQHRALLEQHAKATQSPEALLGLIHFFSVAPTFGDSSLIKVQWSTAPELRQISMALAGALVELGASLKYGPAPRSAAERAVAAALKPT